MSKAGRCAVLLLGTVALGGAGAGGYWYFTQIDRDLEAFERGSTIFDEQWEDLLAHGGDPRVQAALRAKLEQRSSASAGPASDHSFIDHIAAIYRAHPPAWDDAFLRTLARLHVKEGLADFASMAPDYAKSPVVADEMRALLDGMGSDAFGWGEDPGRAEPSYTILVAELAKRGVPEDDRSKKATTRIAVRFGFAAAKKKVEAWGKDPCVTDACVEHLLHIAHTSSYGYVQGEVERALAAIAERKPPLTDDLLDAFCRYGAEKSAAASLRAYGDSVLPRLRARVAAIKDDWLAKQAHELLARFEGGASELTATFMDLAKSVGAPPSSSPDAIIFSPFLGGPKTDDDEARRIEEAATAVAAVGSAGVPRILDWLHDEHRPVVRAAVRALARVDASALLHAVREARATFDPLAKKLAALPSGQDTPPAGFSRRDYLGSGTIVSEAVTEAARSSDRTPILDRLLMEQLSCPDSSASQPTLDALAKRVETTRYVPALFAYLGEKRTVSEWEAGLFVKSLTEREGSGPLIARALDELLAKAGSPERVPWFHKIVGLRALAEVGDADAVPVVEKYAKDGTSFENVSTKTDERGRVLSTERTQETFAELARATLERIQKRGGK